MVVNISAENSIFCQFLAEIRDARIQKDRMRFRRNLERMAEITAYELSKTLKYSEKEVTTPLGDAHVNTIDDEIVLATILRAGIPFHQGFLNYFDKADCAFVSAYRNHSSPEEFEIDVEYSASPSLDGKIVILCDPMLATGNSMASVYEELMTYGTPKRTHIAVGIATEHALSFIEERLPKSVQIWTGAIDNELTAQSYIVPGIGDAGDLAYGEKV